LRAKGLDPHLIYNPDSEYYFGKPANLDKYRVTAQQAMRYEAEIKKARESGAPLPGAPSVNLTGPGKTITGIDIVDIPPGMTPAEAVEWAKKLPKNSMIRLPDGRTRPRPE
jgi:hypothetical protein